ncbi:unnamed protein product [Adineta ricciae]|uniref:Uncharacterized protein n=1 Tax=Adineta ricciae TaxID=249248 RepID=A0A813T4W2_ADIRI|nr:unnamed protein product [Adineta ricciae]CAF0812584.1 unnamed protein product [Adineta ricciae]
MQSSNSTSPLLNHAMRVRAKNVELRKKIAQLESDVQFVEKDILTLTHTYDDLAEQCQVLREKQTDKKKDLLLQQCQTQFDHYINDIENYILNKQWNLPIIEKTSVLSPKLTSTISSDHKTDDLPVPNLNDVLNQQLESVENWLMESAVTDIDKQSPILIEPQHMDDGADDLYKDLIFPAISDDIPTHTEEIQLDENDRQEDFVKTISPKMSQEPHQRLDKNQRRFALMRQLAEKSNKTVTRKLL